MGILAEKSGFLLEVLQAVEDYITFASTFM